ncbi:MAG: hypothetical protein LUD81_05655 [Clostridiales bacterium]|nr:hypothetical protein [Clostridiales bacterium]
MNRTLITLDLGGNTLTLTGGTTYTDTGYTGSTFRASLVNQGTLTVQNGSLKGNGTYTTDNTTYYYVQNMILNTGTLDIKNGVTVTGKLYTITNVGGTVKTAGDITATYYDAIVTYGGYVTVDGGSITATNSSNYGCAIDIFDRNYNRPTSDDGTGATVTINGGTINASCYDFSTNNQRSGYSNLNIYGGTITSVGACIYWPTPGTITIGSEDSTSNDTPYLLNTGGSGIVICCGTLYVYSGTIEASYAATDSTPFDSTYWATQYRASSGMVGLADAISIIANRSSAYAEYPLNINLEGGTYISASNYAVRYANCNAASDSDSDTTQTIDVELSGGTYEGGVTTDGTAVAAVDASCEYEETTNISTLTITGGTYSSDVSSYVDTTKLTVIENDDGTTTVVSGVGVAAIGTTVYDTLANAIAAAKSGDTVKLVANATVESTTIEIKSSQNITLDLGSYTVSGNMSSRMFAVSGTLTIKGNDDGEIKNTGSSNAISNGNTLIIESGKISASSAYAVYNSGNLTVNGGTLTGGTSTTGYAVYIAGGTATINGGTFTSTNTGVGAVRNNATLIINDGTVGDTTNDVYGVYNAGTATVNGGTLSGSTAGLINTTSDSAATVYGGTLQGGKRSLYNSTGSATIYGGTFTGTEYGLMTNSPDTNTTLVYAGTFHGDSRSIVGYVTSTIATGSAFVSGTNESTDSVVAVCAAMIGSGDDAKYYTTLQKAINAAASGAEITLMTDVTEDITVASGKSITIDLNGNTITNSTSHTIINYGTLTITDNSDAKTGTVDCVTHACAALYNYGTITEISGGTFTRSAEEADPNATNSWYSVLNAGTIT